jgi:prevent-host-death family protein
MTIHVNIGEAKTRLSELIAATERGEEVVIARAGKPVVRLAPVAEIDEVARRASAFGMWKGLITDEEIETLLAPLSDEELAEWYDAPIFPNDDESEAAT